jgi:hypothetical protein
MTLNEANQLKKGDVVWWDDPDAAYCSRLYTIKNVAVTPNLVAIEDMSGDFIECLFKELSLAVEKTYRVKVYWEMCGEVEVKAYSRTHAKQEALEAPLPESGTWEYVADSANVDKELDVQEIKP